MKRYIYNILSLVSAFLVVAACNSVVLNEEMQGTGYLGVSLGMDDEVSTKAIVAPSQDMAFRIEIYKGSELIQTVADHRGVTQSDPIELKVGKYKVKAVYGNNEAGFNAPYYVGETDVVITTDDVTTADITCTLANVMVTVDFDQSIMDNFTTYSVFVEDGSGKGITFSKEAGNVDATGYIPATGTLKWTLNLVNTEGKSYSAKDTYTGVLPRQHYDLQFGLSESIGDSGYAAIKLVVDNTLIEQEYDIELDFSESEMPSVSANDGFELTNEMSVMVGDDSKKELTFAAAEGITSFILSVDSEVQTRSADIINYELVEASQSVINALAARGIHVQSIPYGATSVVIDVTDYVKSLPTGNYYIGCALYDSKGHTVKTPLNFAVISDVDADMVSVTPWAKFAIVKGKYFSASAPEGTTFMYKKSSDSAWASVPSSALTFDSTSKTFEAEIGELTGSTSYLIKAVSAEDTETREVEFTTTSAGTLYNMNFEDWYQDGKVYYPYAQGANPSVWDCANSATASFSFSSAKSYTTPDTHSVSGKSARLESENVVIAFAAGNLYTGQFGEIIGTSGASLNWGVPFTSRPVALRGYYDYTSGTINKTKDPYKDMSGQPDKCQILVILTDWNEQFEINTSEGRFVDLSTNNKSIIAIGKMESSVTTNGFVEFTLPLEYRDLTRTPKYIVIACCSSYLGDYFTGSTDSLMYVDEFSFEYDITKLTPEQKAKVNYR